MSRGLLDTSAVIGLADLDADALPQECLISAITLAELSAGPLVTDDPSARAARQAHVQFAEANLAVLPFDDSAARAFGRVASDLRASGRKVSARAYDALIAATALAENLDIYTFNPNDFAGISGVRVHAL